MGSRPPPTDGCGALKAPGAALISKQVKPKETERERERDKRSPVSSTATAGAHPTQTLPQPPLPPPLQCCNKPLISDIKCEVGSLRSKSAFLFIPSCVR